MASVKITLVRPDTSFDWFSRPANEVEYFQANYSTLALERTFSDDWLTRTNIRTGDLALLTRFYNDLNDPACVLYNRRAFCEASNVTYTVEFIGDVEA